MSTYFVLNKKDRSGLSHLRPFQIALKEMKQQEIEEAKRKQSTSLKAEKHRHSVPVQNGFDHHSTNNTPKSTPQMETKINNHNDSSIQFVQTSISKPSVYRDQSTRPSDSTSHPSKSREARSHSRTCELI